jgi:hypothetical protein
MVPDPCRRWDAGLAGVLVLGAGSVWVRGGAWRPQPRGRGVGSQAVCIERGAYERIRETGILRIVGCEHTSQVRYASYNPYDVDQ